MYNTPDMKAQEAHSGRGVSVADEFVVLEATGEHSSPPLLDDGVLYNALPPPVGGAHFYNP